MAKSDGVSRRCAEHAVLNTHITEHHPVAQQKPEAAKYNTCATFHDEWTEFSIRRGICALFEHRGRCRGLKAIFEDRRLLCNGPNAITGLTPSCAHPHDGGRWYVEGTGSTNGTALVSGADRSEVVVEPPAEARAGWTGSPCGDQARRRAGVRQEHTLRGDRGREVRDGSAVVLRAVAQVAVWGVRF